jgi:hypothetical protein
MPSKKTNWSDSYLWKQLQQRAKKSGANHEAAREIRPQVEQWMKTISTVLAKGHTSPQDFTLHDEEHAFRVAQRIWELVPKAQQKHLSDYEVALLLLAAYLHDIGMSPARNQVANVHRYLLTKADGLLSPAEATDFQHWLDEERDGLVPPLCTAAPTPADLELAEEITTYYVRHKHNDWSADWIRQHLAGSLHVLSDWQDVLIRLCQSHHWDHRRLQQSDFSPRPVGSVNPQRLNLRHLACLLRLADILENDPERVPPIIFQHRHINGSAKSIVHWQIPHQLSLVIQDDRVFLSALPLSAAAHKAILALADAIDSELAGCAAIAASQPFHHCIGFNDEKRDWPLAPACHRDVKPRDNAYEYIDGAFRPNTPKLLQLLSGTQLYDTPLAAVRELLQNAFDAVREKIARRRLLQNNPADPKWETELGNHEHVILTLIQEPGGALRLTCQDTGCGMTRAIIEKHLLVSGEARRPPIIELERQCEAAGFHLGRTGQFGIGVLSYFMLAQSVKIQTCRLQDCGDLDAPGWTFITNGVGDFGELRKLPTQPPAGAGTLIEWTLEPKQFPDANKLATDLGEYLRKQLIKIPCTFRFHTELDGEKQTHINFATGWTQSHDDVKRMIAEGWLKKAQEEAVVKATDRAQEIEDKLAIQARMEGWFMHAREALRLAERIITLPGGCGTARIILPWFDLPEGAALAFVLCDRQAECLAFNASRVLKSASKHKSGWRGIRADIAYTTEGYRQMSFLSYNPYDEKCGWIFYDFDHLPDGQLRAHRSAFEIPNEMQVACREMAKTTMAEMTAVLMARGQQPPYYGILNAAVLEQPISLRSGQAWWISHDTTTRFEAITPPFAIELGHVLSASPLYWHGHRVSCPAKGGRIGHGATLLKCCFPERVMAAKVLDERHRKERFTPVAFWTGNLPGPPTRFIPFPPEWNQIFGSIAVNNLLFFNRNNWAVKLVGQSMLEEYTSQNFRKEPDWEKAAFIDQPREAALTLMQSCVTLGQGKWKNLTNSHPKLLSHLWEICSKACEIPADQMFLLCFTQQEVHSISLDAYRSSNYFFPGAGDIIPEVTDPEWLLESK